MADLPLIDVNVTLGQWPTRRVPGDNPQRLADKLRSHHVTEAWAAHYYGLLHEDLTAVNDRLVAACTAASSSDLRFRPFGTVNPRAENWKAELKRCAATHRMLGIRIYPNYHGYSLGDQRVRELVSCASDHGLIVQIPVLLEDARMMHPLWRVPPVDLAPLQAALVQTGGVKLVLLNALTGSAPSDTILRLIESDRVFVDIATLEGAAGIERILKTIPLDRILFGSHAPNFYFEAAALKLQESTLSPAQLVAIAHHNAQNLIVPEKAR